MKNHKLYRFGTVLVLFALLTCLLTVSAFAGENAEWGYQQLDANQQAAYRAIEAAVKDRADTVNLSGVCEITKDDLEPLYEVLRMIVADHPEYYWFLGNIGSQITVIGGHLGTLHLEYDTVYNVFCCEDCSFWNDPNAEACACPDCQYGQENPGKTDPEEVVFQNAVKDIMPDFSAAASDYEKALLIHDALADHIVYDYAYQFEQSAYSAIVNGRAVCAGFARAYQYLLNQVGIDAWTVEGFGVNPQTGGLEAHAWTLLWIDGHCVYTDVTWDNQDALGQTFYAYFNRSYEEISKDHVTDLADFEGYEDMEWIDYFGDKLPARCGHDEDSYFAMNNINKIPYVSVETLATNVSGTGTGYLFHVLFDNFDEDAFKSWLEVDYNANLFALIDALGVDNYAHVSIEHTYLGEELRITVTTDAYQAPMPEMMGYIYEVAAKGELTAYVNYTTSGLDLNEEYENVMVACYGEEDELLSVDIITLELNQDGHGTVTADCPDDFSYCRIFVVDSDENPAPLCDLLQLNLAQ